MKTNIIAGETLTFNESFADYKASDGWGLNIHLRGPGVIDLTATADGDEFDITVLAPVTAGWIAGDYWYESYAFKLNERYRADYGRVTITKDISQTTGTYDGRSSVKILLDAIEATLLGKATNDQLAYTIAGRSISTIPVPDLIKLRDLYKTEYQAEVTSENLDKGLGSGNKIYTRFTG